MYGNPHQDRRSFLGPLNNRGMGKEQEQIHRNMNPGGTRIVPSNGIGPFPKRESGFIPFNQIAGGYDSGNRRPIRDGQGNLVPQRPVFGEKFPRTPTPNYIPIMDYTGSRTASMDPGSKYNGTYKQPGYADPRFDDYGQEEYYDNRDYYMDDVIDPGLSGYDRGPLYFS